MKQASKRLEGLLSSSLRSVVATPNQAGLEQLPGEGGSPGRWETTTTNQVAWLSIRLVLCNSNTIGLLTCCFFPQVSRKDCWLLVAHADADAAADAGR